MGSVRLYGATSGYLELQAPDVAPDSTLVLPSDSLQPGLVHLHTESFSAKSSVSVDDVFSADYDSYEVIVSSLYPSATGNNVYLYMRSSGTDETSNYWYATEYLQVNNTTTRGSGAPASFHFITVSSAANAGFMSTAIRIINPAVAAATRINSESFGYTGSSNAAINASGSLNTLTAYDGFTLSISSGTISGTIRVYGYRNS
jgi:hypothetical protein